MFLSQELQNDVAINLFFLRMALQQFKYQEHFVQPVYRYKYMYSAKSNKFNMQDAFVSLFKYPFEDYVIFAFAVFLLSAHNKQPLTAEQIVREVGRGKSFTHEKAEDILSKLSMNRDVAIQKYNDLKGGDKRLRIYDYNPFSMKPFLRIDNTIYCPIPQLIFSAITKGFYHLLCYENDIEFRQTFGKEIFQQYVGHVLTWDNSYQVIPEFAYKVGRGSEAQSSDFILVDNNDLILMEVKATAPTIALRRTDFSEYQTQVFKACAVGVKQCINKEAQIRQGIITHDLLPDNIDNIYYVIVTLEDFLIPTTHFFRQQVEILLEESGTQLPSGKPFHFISVKELEGIIERDKRKLFDFFKEREEQGRVFTAYTIADIRHDHPPKEQRTAKVFEEIINSFINDSFRKGS